MRQDTIMRLVELIRMQRAAINSLLDGELAAIQSQCSHMYPRANTTSTHWIFCSICGKRVDERTMQ